MSDAGVVDENIHATVARDDVFKSGVYRGRVADIAEFAGSLVAVGFEFGHRSVDCILLNVDDHYRRTMSREAFVIASPIRKHRPLRLQLC